MRVLFLGPDLNKQGGVKTFCQAVMKSFGQDVQYFVRGSRPGRSFLYNKSIVYFKDYLRYFKTLNSVAFDLVHLNLSLGYGGVFRDIFFIVVAKLFKIKVLLYFHGWNEAFEKRLVKNYLPFFKLIYFNTDAMAFVGNAFKEKIETWGFTGATYLLSSVMDESILSGLDENEVCRKTENIEDGFNILFLARVELEKGIMESIMAFSLIKKKYSQAKLIVAGEGTKLESAKDFARQNHIRGIEFQGYIFGRKKIETFRRSHVYILPTYHGEGMPHSVLEAMGFGLPVITRPIGGVIDFFKNGKMGFITESKDPAVLAGLIESLMENTELRRNMATYNFNYAQQQFLSSEVVKRLEKIYKDTINE